MVMKRVTRGFVCYCFVCHTPNMDLKLDAMVREHKEIMDKAIAKYLQVLQSKSIERLQVCDLLQDDLVEKNQDLKTILDLLKNSDRRKEVKKSIEILENLLLLSKFTFLESVQRKMAARGANAKWKLANALLHSSVHQKPTKPEVPSPNEIIPATIVTEQSSFGQSSSNINIWQTGPFFPDGTFEHNPANLGVESFNELHTHSSLTPSCNAHANWHPPGDMYQPPSQQVELAGPTHFERSHPPVGYSQQLQAYETPVTSTQPQIHPPQMQELQYQQQPQQQHWYHSH